MAREKLRLPRSAEKGFGRVVSSLLLLQFRPVDNHPFQGELESVGQKVAEVLGCSRARFMIVDSRNVFALVAPDGTILVSETLLKKLGSDEAALAGILAHEMGHVVLRHAVSDLERRVVWTLLLTLLLHRRPPWLWSGLLLSELAHLGSNRKAEMEADRRAFKALQDLGYPTDARRRFLEKLSGLEQFEGWPVWLRTHPPLPQRLESLEDSPDGDPRKDT